MVRHRKLAVAVAFALSTTAPFAVPTASGGLSGYEVMVNATPEDDSPYKTLTVPCPPGKTAIGGGAGIFWTASPRPKLISSFQYGDGLWYAEAESSDGQVWSLWVQTNCAIITP